MDHIQVTIFKGKFVNSIPDEVIVYGYVAKRVSIAV